MDLYKLFDHHYDYSLAQNLGRYLYQVGRIDLHQVLHGEIIEFQGKL